MNQRPIDGAQPLPAPGPDMAAAYLDELDRVRARREERIDRRALATVSLIGAVVLAAYVALASFTVGTGPSNSSFLVLVPVFALWLQVTTEFRESRGALGSPIARNRPAMLGFIGVLSVIVIAGPLISLFDIAVPVHVRLIPAMVALLMIGVPALRDLRRSSRLDRQVPGRPLTTPERMLTIGIGVLVAASVWVLGAGDFFSMSVFAMVAGFGYLAWWITGRLTEGLPAVGAVWARTHWVVFAVGGAAMAGVVFGQLLGFTTTMSQLAPFAAVILLSSFCGATFVDGRDG